MTDQPNDIAVAEETIEPDDGPTPMIRGAFAIYVKDDGGMIMGTDIEGRGIEYHSVPAKLVKMMTGNTPIAKLLRKTFSGVELES